MRPNKSRSFSFHHPKTNCATLNMMRFMLLPAIAFMMALTTAYTQADLKKLTDLTDIAVIDEYEGEQGYYVFYPIQKPASHALTPVVFVHGYGGLNPMIYGGWIRHLIEAGHCVIYPRYQWDLIGTSPNDFVDNTTVAIKTALEQLNDSQVSLNTEHLYLVGHSYGGVIIANLAANWESLGIPQPRVAFLCEPGHGPFKGGVLDSYADIDSTILMAIMVGDRDQTVGQEFGRKVYDSALNVPNRMLLWQYACESDSLNVTASHYEPYSLDAEFDNGIDNFTSRRALKVARLDHIDTEGYWKVFDMLVDKAIAADYSGYAPEFLEKCSDLGVWPDGTALCKMDCHHPEFGMLNNK